MSIKNFTYCSIFMTCLFTGNKIFAQNFVPTNLPNLSLWLRADSGVTQNGNSVSLWHDQSGNGNNAIQPSQVNQPLLIYPTELCGKQALQFDGVNDSLAGPQISGIGSSSITLFVVAKLNTVINNRTIFSVGGVNGMFLWHAASSLQFRNSGMLVSAGNSNVQQYYLLTAEKSIGVSDSIFRNGNLVGTMSAFAASAFSDTSNYSIGKLASVFNFFSGEIAEIVLYQSALSLWDREMVEKYLFDKYAAKPNLGSDTTSQFGFCPITLGVGSCFKNYLWSTGDTTANLSINHTGSYWVRTIDIFGRSLSDTINVTYPEVLISANGDTLTASNAITYQWYFNDSIISGADSATFIASQSGYYSVEATDTNGCHTVSNPVNLTISGVFSIRNPNSDIRIFPNPASTQLFIETNGTAVEQINIYNTTGSLVMAAGAAMANGQLSIVHLPSGVYIADIKTKEGSTRKRWVKM